MKEVTTVQLSLESLPRTLDFDYNDAPAGGVVKFPPAPPGPFLHQTVYLDVEVTRMPRLTNSCKTSGLRFRIGPSNGATLTPPLTALFPWNTEPYPLIGRVTLQLNATHGDPHVDDEAHITRTEGPYTCRVQPQTGSLTVYGASRTVTTLVPDTTPPVISSVAVGNVTINRATITWSTNEAATQQVEYGPTIAYGTLSPLDPGLGSNHSLTLTGMTTLHPLSLPSSEY